MLSKLTGRTKVGVQVDAQCCILQIHRGNCVPRYDQSQGGTGACEKLNNARATLGRGDASTSITMACSPSTLENGLRQWARAGPVGRGAKGASRLVAPPKALHTPPFVQAYLAIAYTNFPARTQCDPISISSLNSSSWMMIVSLMFPQRMPTTVYRNLKIERSKLRYIQSKTSF